MLQCLNDWRAQCTTEQLAAFESLLSDVCGTAIPKTTINKRYAGSYHKALIHEQVLAAACTTGQSRLRPGTSRNIDLGIELVVKIARNNGSIAITKLTKQEKETAAVLSQRGVIFAHQKRYCLPAEYLVDANSGIGNDWITRVCSLPVAMLYQLVPAQAQAEMLKPKARRNEMAAWLIVHGQQARRNKPNEQLDERDWLLLLALQESSLEDFEDLQDRYPDLPSIEGTQHGYYSNPQSFSLRKAFEKHIPEQLIKLFRLGLIVIITYRADHVKATVSLCSEAVKLLSPHWVKARQYIADQLQKQWQAEPCDIEYPSAWSMDQDLWRVWVILHFLPLGITKQGKLRKHDIKKIATCLRTDDCAQIEFWIFSLLKSELIVQSGYSLSPAEIHWKNWATTMRNNICKHLRGWEAWNAQDEKQAITLLLKLPTHCWLKFDEVIEWLRAQCSARIINADWVGLFTQYPNEALHHLNLSQHSIYFLPEFHAVLQNKAVSFPAPGWHGAHKKANINGFISASGEIQLPPDCNHKVLDQLAGYCTISAIEQMITLQLDEKALQRLGNDKAVLKKIRKLLELLQSPLPQAVAYMLDKQLSQTAIAEVASTAMVIVLRDASAIHKLHSTGFAFTQPFKDKQEIVLLDASADAFAFIHACNEAGILLETLIKPAQWISGTVAINDWMDINLDREGQWLEISYQKTRSSKPKQLIARIDADYYGAVRIQPTRKTKQGYALLKSTVQLQPKHVLRLRELAKDEMKKIGLDTL